MKRQTNKRAGKLTNEAVEISKAWAGIYRRCHPKYSANVGHRSIRALQYLAELPRTVGELAKYLGIAPNSASEIAKRLVTRGYASKVRDTQDERVVRLICTESGVGILQEQTNLDLEKLSRCMARLSPDQRSSVRSGFKILFDSLADNDG